MPPLCQSSQVCSIMAAMVGIRSSSQPRFATSQLQLSTKCQEPPNASPEGAVSYADCGGDLPAQLHTVLCSCIAYGPHSGLERLYQQSWGMS